MRNFILSIVMSFAFVSMHAQPYKDPTLSADQRAADLLSRLTLEEKAKLMEHSSPAIERLGIPQFDWWNEALHGVARNGLATVYPITMAMAATFDDALVQNAFTAASDEARAKNNVARKAGHSKRYEGLSFWTPNINIFRDPRWGRGQETYGEDPYLTTRMGLAVVRGLQGPTDSRYRKLLACAKHFAVHSGPEYIRHKQNVELVPTRDLWETYLPAFKALVQEGDVQEVMCAYNSYDGEPCCGNTRLLKEILRDEWGFKGLVTSDCWAVDDFWKKDRHEFLPTRSQSISRAVSSGTDLECGGTYRYLPDAVSAGEITEEKINTSLHRLLKARFELGDFDSEELVSWKNMGPEHIASDEHHQISLDLARKSIVLLQNKDNILPLDKNLRVAVIGPNANDSIMMWGNYNGFPRHTTTILDGIRQKCDNVIYMKACELVTRTETKDDAKGPAMDYGHDNAIKNGKKEEIVKTTKEEVLAFVKDVDVVVFVGGISPRLEGEEMRVSFPGFKGGDRTSIELPQIQRELLAYLSANGKKIVYVNCSGSAMALVPETESCKAIVQAWYGGEGGGEALADVLFGDCNPSGRLPITFYSSTEQLPDYESYDMKGRTYRFMTQKPLYPFGFGLSYSKVSYSKASYKKDEVTVTLTNESARDAEEVVQVYVRRVGDVDGPLKTLRAFKRVAVPSNSKVNVSIPIAKDAFNWWDSETNTVHFLPGKYELLVGSSSDSDALMVVPVTI